jgi:hypothetical protein
MPSGVLVIVPCGRSKIWDKKEDHGPAAARDAYIGPPFKLNRRYAERFGDRWVILSAKYGFIDPDFEIPESYDVSFKLPSTKPIDPAALQVQIAEIGLHRHRAVVGLGGAAYRKAIKAAFAPFDVPVVFPFASMPIGMMMQATKRAIELGQPEFEEEAEF